MELFSLDDLGWGLFRPRRRAAGVGRVHLRKPSAIRVHPVSALLCPLPAPAAPRAQRGCADGCRTSSPESVTLRSRTPRGVRALGRALRSPPRRRCARRSASPSTTRSRAHWRIEGVSSWRPIRAVLFAGEHSRGHVRAGCASLHGVDDEVGEGLFDLPRVHAREQGLRLALDFQDQRGPTGR